MSTSDHTVLIVDDEPRIVQAHKRWLQDEYDVRTATDGEEALAAAGNDVDVILLDQRMPGMDGSEVAAEIRNDEELQNCFIVLVTSMKPDFGILDFAVDDYLHKPASKDSLTTVIERVLTQREYDGGEQLRELYALSAKRAVLADHQSTATFESNSRASELNQRITELSDSIDLDLGTDVDQDTAYEPLF